MSVRYLVDTDWAIDHLRGRPEITRQLKLREPDSLELPSFHSKFLPLDQEAVVLGWNPPRSRKVLTESGDYCRVAGERDGASYRPATIPETGGPEVVCVEGGSSSASRRLCGSYPVSNGPQRDSPMMINNLTETVIGAAIEVHRPLVS